MKKLIVVICVFASLKSFSQSTYDLMYTFKPDREVIYPVFATWFNLSRDFKCKFDCTKDSTYYHLDEYAFAMAKTWYMRFNPRYLSYIDSLPKGAETEQFLKCPCK